MPGLSGLSEATERNMESIRKILQLWDFPPAYFAYGTRDPFVGEFEECIQALEEAGVSVESHVLEGMPHGFGAEGGWIDGYDQWLGSIFAEG